MTQNQNIYIIEDDVWTRDSLEMLLSAAHFSVKTFESVSDFFADSVPRAGCVIVDVKTPGINWLTFQIDLAKHKHDVVILVISGHSDIPMIIGAMRQGVVDFIEMPFDAHQIVASVRRALSIRATAHDRWAEATAAQMRLTILTPRERAVAEQLIEGESSRTIATELGISHRTVEAHRANILKKLKIANVSHLVRLMMLSKHVETAPNDFPIALRKNIAQALSE